MTSDDAERGAGQSENKAAEKEKSAAMPPNEATPATAPSAPAAATGANGKDAPNEAVNADVEAGKLYEQDGVGGKVEFTANKAEDGEGNKVHFSFSFHYHLVYITSVRFVIVVEPVPGDDQGRADALRQGPLLGAPALDSVHAVLARLARHARRVRGDHRPRPQVLPAGCQGVVAEGTRLPSLPQELQGFERRRQGRHQR